MLNPRGRGDCRQRSSISEYAQGPHGILKPRGRTTTCKATMGRGRLAGVLGHARCGPRCGRRRHSRQGVRRARRLQKKAAQRGRRPIIFLYPFPYAASALRRSSTNAWNGALARRAPQGPARRTAARSAAKSPASPPNEGSKDARTKVAAVRRQGLVGMRACRSPAARAAGCYFVRVLGRDAQKTELAPRRAQPSFAPRAP